MSDHDSRPRPRRPLTLLAVGVAAAALAACTPMASERGASYSASELGIEVSGTPLTTGDESGADGPAAPAGGVTAPGSEPAAPTAPRTPAPPEGTFVTPGERPGIAGCDLFPRDNAFHASIQRLPVHPRSDSMLSAAGGASLVLNAGFSAAPWEGARPGYPVNIADSRSSEVTGVVARTHTGTSDTEGHPMPTAPRFEGWPANRWDRHLLVVDPATCTSHEMIGVTPPGQNPLGAWFVDKAVTIDLGSNAYRGGGTVKVAGVSMLAGLVRYDEVATGELDHAISMSLPSAGGRSVWPARSSDGPNPDPAAPPMGTWLRLRGDVDLSSLGPQARTIARALQDHGGVLADTGGRFALSGEPDVRWDDADLRGLRGLTVADFEVVDPMPMMVSRDSLRIR